MSSINRVHKKGFTATLFLTHFKFLHYLTLTIYFQPNVHFQILNSISVKNISKIPTTPVWVFQSENVEKELLKNVDKMEISILDNLVSD